VLIADRALWNRKRRNKLSEQDFPLHCGSASAAPRFADIQAAPNRSKDSSKSAALRAVLTATLRGAEG
jgi:hypothetical protein